MFLFLKNYIADVRIHVVCNRGPTNCKEDCEKEYTKWEKADDGLANTKQNPNNVTGNFLSTSCAGVLAASEFGGNCSNGQEDGQKRKNEKRPRNSFVHFSKNACYDLWKLKKNFFLTICLQNTFTHGVNVGNGLDFEVQQNSINDNDGDGQAHSHTTALWKIFFSEKTSAKKNKR